MGRIHENIRIDQSDLRDFLELSSYKFTPAKDSNSEIVAKTEKENIRKFFCRIGTNLRLRQKIKLS